MPVKCDKSAYKLFHEATIALSDVEANGICVDQEYLNRTTKDVADKIDDYARQMRESSEFKFWKRRFRNKVKLSAHQQLADVVFKDLGFKSEKRTLTGELAGDEEAFADVIDKVNLVKLFFQREKMKKVHGTYLAGIRREMVNGYIHPNYNLNLVISYRSSSDNPNFQNVPKRNKEMAEYVRRCLKPRPGRILAEVDFSGAEVRVAACYNKDPQLIKYIQDPATDMHRDTASDIFKLPLSYLIEHKDWAKKTVRDTAKNMFVFPEFYGSVWFQCGPNIWKAIVRKGFRLPDNGPTLVDHLHSKGIRELGEGGPQTEPTPGTFLHHLREVERKFWDRRFKVYTDWKRRWYRDYLDAGGFKTYTGFAFNGTFSRNDVLNYAVQGSAFHCLLISLYRLNKWLKKNKMRTCIVGQIHDSLVVDVHPEELQDFIQACRQIMSIDLVADWKWLIVPMEIEIETSEVDGNWFELKEIKC